MAKNSTNTLIETFHLDPDTLTRGHIALLERCIEASRDAWHRTYLLFGEQAADSAAARAHECMLQECA